MPATSTETPIDFGWFLPSGEEAERFGKYAMPHSGGRTTTSTATAAA